ncbi:MAG: aminotransferase class I/II-fold pyridoxal phosphate-dependent enzyme [Bacteroidia bacterium]|nr:MAG: aminotransferase class I/II-fold pyridoxal phosphate-dependent enzyme [Bacteroidia bacterium]
MDYNDFRRHGHVFVDWLADYFEQIEQLPVKSRSLPGDILSQLPASPPDKGEEMENIFRDFREIIIPGITHWQHPGWFAYFPANNSPPSVLAEMLTAGLGSQCMSWLTSPAATELEERLMEWLRKMTGLPEDMTGVIQDTASTATLCALLSARETATGFEANRKGVTGDLIVYASTETHSSIEKGVKIAGFGKDNLRLVKVRDDFSMCPEALENTIRHDLELGLKPACVVATLGTTSSMAMDPLEAIAGICSQYGIWLHVDAAFAGTAAIEPAHRAFMRGVERCDSFVFNPHKWMLTNFDCSAYFVRNPDILLRTLTMQPEYLKTDADRQVKNYRDWGIQLGRRFRALKLWFVIRSYGVEGIREMINRHIGLAALFETRVHQDRNFELLAPRQLSLVCFRYNPGRETKENLDALNRQLLDAVNNTGKVFLTHTSLAGKFCIRLSVGQRTTSEKHVQLAWQLIREAAARLTAP